MLASIGHLLYPIVSKIYIPATYSYHMLPCGSHPLLDPLWSTESIQFVHDGFDATRVAKAKLVSTYDQALKSLRVCWDNPCDGACNCGVCEKCIRTMINLYVSGSLDRCTTFDVTLDPKCISRVGLATEGQRGFAEENLRALGNRQTDREIYNALRKSLDRSAETPSSAFVR